MERIEPYRKQDLKLMACGLLLRNKTTKDMVSLEEMNLVNDSTGEVIYDEVYGIFDGCHYEATLSNGQHIHEKDMFLNYEYADGTPFGNVIEGYRMTDWQHGDDGLEGHQVETLLAEMPFDYDYANSSVIGSKATISIEITLDNASKAKAFATRVINMAQKTAEDYKHRIDSKRFFKDMDSSEDTNFVDMDILDDMHFMQFSDDGETSK